MALDQTPPPVWTEQAPQWSDASAMVGHHNSTLAQSTARFVQGATWKNLSTVAVIPAAKMVPFKWAMTLRHLLTPPNQQFLPVGAQGLEVGEAYSTTIEAIINDKRFDSWPYLLTIEHDNIAQPDGLLKLYAHMEAHPEFACIGGLYWTKGPGGCPQIWGDPKDPIMNFRPQPPDPSGGLVECNGTGMGFNLWRLSMFRDPKLRRPWFKTLNGSEGQGVGTQDLYFWGDARAKGYRCAVACDVLVGHYDQTEDKTW